MSTHTLYISYFIEHNGDDEPHDICNYTSYCTCAEQRYKSV